MIFLYFLIVLIISLTLFIFNYFKIIDFSKIFKINNNIKSVVNSNVSTSLTTTQSISSQQTSNPQPSNQQASNPQPSNQQASNPQPSNPQPSDQSNQEATFIPTTSKKIVNQETPGKQESDKSKDSKSNENLQTEIENLFNDLDKELNGKNGILMNDKIKLCKFSNCQILYNDFLNKLYANNKLNLITEIINLLKTNKHYKKIKNLHDKIPEEISKFDKIDKTYKEYLKQIFKEYFGNEADITKILNEDTSNYYFKNKETLDDHNKDFNKKKLANTGGIKGLKTFGYAKDLLDENIICHSDGYKIDILYSNAQKKYKKVIEHRCNAPVTNKFTKKAVKANEKSCDNCMRYTTKLDLKFCDPLYTKNQVKQKCGYNQNYIYVKTVNDETSTIINKKCDEQSGNEQECYHYDDEVNTQQNANFKNINRLYNSEYAKTIKNLRDNRDKLDTEYKTKELTFLCNNKEHLCKDCYGVETEVTPNEKYKMTLTRFESNLKNYRNIYYKLKELWKNKDDNLTNEETKIQNIKNNINKLISKYQSTDSSR